MLENSTQTYLSLLLNTANKWPSLISSLPSQGLIYPPNHFFSQHGKVVYGKLSGRDEEWATEPIFKDTYSLNYILQNKIEFNTPPISIDNMLVADRDIMLVNHRLTTFGVELHGVEIKCKQCQKKLNTTDLIIIKINYEPLSEKPYIPNSNVFQWQSPDQEYKVLFQLPTVSINQKFQDITAKRGMVPFEDWINLLVLQINNEADRQGILDLMEEMPLGYYHELREYVEEIEPYVLLQTSQLYCYNCSTDNTITTEFGLGLLQLNDRIIRQIAIKEFHFINKNLNITFNELYEMPIENRKRLLKRNSDYMEEVAEARREMENKKK